MKSSIFIRSLQWIRSQVLGVVLAIIAILVAAVYAAPYSPSAFGYAKYDTSCSAVPADASSATRLVFCIRVDTTTGESNCKVSTAYGPSSMTWSNCANGGTPSNPW